ncbi:MAG: secondary thiamine-phosphate synthase enzyme YjbQ [Acidithiobacillus sp.]
MSMQHVSQDWRVNAGGRGLHELTDRIQRWLEEIKAQEGWLNVFVPHTSASLLLQENADPDVQADILDYFLRMVPDGDPRFRHRNEGPDDMSAHLRSVLTQNSLVIPVREGRAALGVWQGVFLFEHRSKPLNRQVLVSFQGKVEEV